MLLAQHVSVREAFGLRPLAPALRDGWRSLAGHPHVPPTQWGLSSARIFKPSISLPTWLRRARSDRRVPIYNFVNRVPQRKDEGYSVRVTFARDFRGGRFTYDGHLGTDFAVPVGTRVAAPAPGVVLRVACEIDRGGLKVCIDHGRGLFTTLNHLSRALVHEGEVVKRRQVVALSGASGMEFVLLFPWVAPHVHFNTFLDGVPCDPFAREGEVSLWKKRNDPVPHDGSESKPFEPTVFRAEDIDDAIDDCVDAGYRWRMAAFPTVERRAAELMVQRNYRPTLFRSFPPLYRDVHEPRPVLDLMFRREDYVGVAMP